MLVVVICGVHVAGLFLGHTISLICVTKFLVHADIRRAFTGSSK